MLTYPLTKTGGVSLYEQLYRRIKDDILTGRLAAGEKLPSKRALAAHLVVSVSSVKIAYEQLMAEGYFYGIEMRGYYVSPVQRPLAAQRAASPAAAPAPQSWEMDLVTNSIAAEDFPFTVWARLMRQTILEEGTGLLHAMPPQGAPELRTAIAAYLRQFRGMAVDAEQIMEEVAHDNADVVFTTSIRMRPACLKVAAQHPKTRFLNCCLNAPHPLVRTYYPRTYEANYLLGMLAGILNLTDRVGYVAANPVYGVPAAINAFARGLRTVRPNSHILLRWACLQEPGKPLDFSDCPDIELFYACSPFEPTGSAREYGLCRRMPDGSIQPVALPVWKWEVFYIGIIRSIFEGTWDSGSSGKAINYWWGFRSDAERLDYYETLPKGTQQLLDLLEKNLAANEFPIFPAGIFAQGHIPKAPTADTYTPKELKEMDWLGECVEGSLPRYDQLDVRTLGLLEINGLSSLKETTL